MAVTTTDQVFIEPDQLPKLSKEKLVEIHETTRYILEQLDSQSKIIREELGNRIKGDGEVIGNYAVTKVKMVTFPEVDLEKAKELGAVKEAIDANILKRLLSKGAKIPAKIVKYVRIKEISLSKDVDIKTET